MVSEAIVPPPESAGGAVPRLFSQVAGSSIGTVFYTPGGVAGWALDLVLRTYLAHVRRLTALREARAALTRGHGPRSTAKV